MGEMGAYKNPEMMPEACQVGPEYVGFYTEDEGAKEPSKPFCYSCRRFWRVFYRQISEHAQYILYRFPFITHFLERRMCIKSCGFCWCILLSMLTGLLLFYFLLMFSFVSGLPLDNDQLFESVGNMTKSNYTFTRVCRFKDWTYFAGSFVGKIINHHGVVLEVANPQGQAVQFLQMEYGARGTFWQIATAPYPDARYGIVAMDKVAGMPCRYKCGDVDPAQRSPERLLWFLKKYRKQGYNIFHYNCIVFAEMVLNFHLPAHRKTECFTTAEMQQHYGEVSRRVAAAAAEATKADMIAAEAARVAAEAAAAKADAENS